mmetsp:Transcript_32214/g.57789  ORF Transcript_32214/g.57789 Transcript_32214/m.57789 type:complete len:100 (-) Transcript_32214:558-857(-)
MGNSAVTEYVTLETGKVMCKMMYDTVDATFDAHVDINSTTKSLTNAELDHLRDMIIRQRSYDTLLNYRIQDRQMQHMRSQMAREVDVRQSLSAPSTQTS